MTSPKWTAVKGSLFLLIAFAFSACKDCSKKTSCPAYENGLNEAWFPYADNTVLNFQTGTGGQKTVTLSLVNTSRPYEYSRGLNSPPQQCGASKAFQSRETGSVGNILFAVDLFQTRENDVLTGHSADIAIEGDNIRVSDIGNEVAHITLRTSATAQAVHPSLTLGNRTFTNVQSGKRDTVTDKTTGIVEAYLVKGQGLVAFTRYPEGKLWVLQ
jgi:hypothetical protein